MQIDVQFLTQYRGDTKQSRKVADRFGWANTEVDITDRALAEFMPVLLADSGARDLTVFHDGSGFWVDADTVNLYRYGSPGGMGDFTANWHSRRIAGISNFQGREQRRFSWNAFGFALFDRAPAGHFHTLNPDNIKNYRPGTVVEWDETTLIAERLRGFLTDNVVNAEGTALCRIERPCFTIKNKKTKALIATPIFTPFGGFGDPLVDHSSLYRATYDADFMSNIRWTWAIDPHQIEELDRAEADPGARSVRAVLMDLFRQKSWLAAQKTVTRTKASQKVARLHAIWKRAGISLDEEHLDNVAGVMQSIAEDSRVIKLLESWFDRPIGI